MRSVSASVVGDDATPRAVLGAMDAAGVDELPVAARDGTLRGMVERRIAQRHLYDGAQYAQDAQEETPAAAIAEQEVARAAPDDAIEGAVEQMLAHELSVLPVVSARGPAGPEQAHRIEGLLVLDDLRHVPGLVEAVDDRRHRGEAAAAAGFTRTAMACGLGSAAIGLALFALWLSGPAYGLPGWVAWVDAVAALLAFVGAVTASARDMIAVPVWAVAGIGLCFAAANGHAWHDGRWATWLQLAFGIAFLAMVAVIGTALPRRHRRAFAGSSTPL